MKTLRVRDALVQREVCLNRFTFVPPFSGTQHLESAWDSFGLRTGIDCLSEVCLWGTDMYDRGRCHACNDMYVCVMRRQVPWKTFASGRASLHISGVTLVLEPLGSANYEDEIERALRHAIFAKKQVRQLVYFAYLPNIDRL